MFLVGLKVKKATFRFDIDRWCSSPLQCLGNRLMVCFGCLTDSLYFQ